MIRHCIHGHPWDEANTRWISKTSPKGKKYHFRQCRTCARNRQRKKYRDNDQFREAEKARNKANYERGRDATRLRRKPKVVLK